MDIQEYIAQTLQQINSGIAAANATNGDRRFMLRRGEPIKFDLAVVNQTTSGGKVNATVLGIGGNTGGSVSKDQLSRISFQVEHHPQRPGSVVL